MARHALSSTTSRCVALVTVASILLAACMQPASGCSVPPNWEPQTTQQRADTAPIVVLARVNATRSSGSLVTGTVATLDIRCAFAPFRPHYTSGAVLDTYPTVAGDSAYRVDVAGFGDASECKSNVEPGQQAIFFLTNVSGSGSWGGYELSARYDDIYGATATVTRDNVFGVMASTAPEGHYCAVEANVDWYGNCISLDYRVPNGWTGKGDRVNHEYCQICSCWDGLLLCTDNVCPPRSAGTGLRAHGGNAILPTFLATTLAALALASRFSV